MEGRLWSHPPNSLWFISPAPDSFCAKKFFQICGLTKKSPQDIKKVFGILDNDASGFIEEEELKWVRREFINFPPPFSADRI